ncbi:hypothetical protein ACL02T_34705, partial [Pseudonocardia sp. RS010]|uniref:hypothetical protein n=1 Tax=Pseudonocardia sp. RS010 TaxID=3385979 RepID=UPI0039A1E038
MPVEQPDHPRKLSDKEVQRGLLLTFDRVARLRDAISHYDQVPEPGSPLRRDDELAHPYGLSHAVVRQLQAAVDHLDAVRALIVEAQKIHNAAPFTLTRGALETASAAV